MMGSMLFIFGIVMMVGGFGSNSPTVGVVGIVLTVAGAILFWRTSATKAYLDNNKRKQ